MGQGGRERGDGKAAQNEKHQNDLTIVKRCGEYTNGRRKRGYMSNNNNI